MSDTMMTPSTEDHLHSNPQGVKEAFSNLASEASRYAHNRLGNVKDSAGAVLSSAKAKAGEYNNNAIGFIRKHPWTSVGIAAGAGLTLGLLLRSLHRR